MTALSYEQKFCTGFTLHLAVDAGATEAVLKLGQGVKVRNLHCTFGDWFVRLKSYVIIQ